MTRPIDALVDYRPRLREKSVSASLGPFSSLQRKRESMVFEHLPWVHAFAGTTILTNSRVYSQPGLINGARRPAGRAPLLRGAIAFVIASLLQLTICFSVYADVGCPKPAGPPGASYSGQTLSTANFSHRDLTNADFSNAHLTSPNFIGANLTCANFSGATIDTDPTNSLTADFSFANLTNASFYEAKIGDSAAPVYFEYATLTCADFSKVRLIDDQNNDLVIFGESLNIAKDPSGGPNKCRTAFRSDPMNCQFIDDWRWLDLDDAKIGACLSQLRKKDFSGGKFAGVDFTSGSLAQTDLTDTKWRGAELSGANFDYAILENADFTNAHLMSISDRTPARLGANLDFADLNNAVFTGADLTKASFTWATLTGPNVSLTGATLTGSDWDHATLSGVTLDGLKAWGANFADATLNNSTLKNTDLGLNSYIATGTTNYDQAKLEGATLCGATLDATILTCAKLAGAQVLSANPTADCKDAKITTTPPDTPPPNGEYTTKTDGVSSEIICSTTCPDSTSGPCIRDAQWQPPTPVSKQCCVWKKGDPPCPPRLKPGAKCSMDCDCASQHCEPASGADRKCTSNADLTKALLRDQTDRRH
jgi:uncharacterized protein YjbI with pentapeptide repeats